ncbi:hypothetical protein BDZ45DRAFT_748926 [Acephala macrosclerotiorum]|nr:hypothetical protein BDZ45DRAFT_748926 [Acephala macrosclerotiorum]
MNSVPKLKLVVGKGKERALNYTPTAQSESSRSTNNTNDAFPNEAPINEAFTEDDPTIYTPLPAIPRTTNDHRHFSKEDHELLEAAFVKHKGRNPPRGAFNKLMRDLKRTGRGGIRSWFTVRRKKEADDIAQRERVLKIQVASDAQVSAGLIAGSMNDLGVEEEDEQGLGDVDEDENGNEEDLGEGEALMDERE